jgi:hypothetical protein
MNRNSANRSALQDGRRSDAKGGQVQAQGLPASLPRAVLLEIGDAPCKDHFSFQAMTGKRDRNKNTFYGLVRAMKDPARWSNKWMSQTMHIMNTTSKGGIAAERGGFFDNDADGESSWAKSGNGNVPQAGRALGPKPEIHRQTGRNSRKARLS